jgi:hypothetical protein
MRATLVFYFVTFADRAQAEEAVRVWAQPARYRAEIKARRDGGFYVAVRDSEGVMVGYLKAEP